jgi:hypothetical protein
MLLKETLSETRKGKIFRLLHAESGGLKAFEELGKTKIVGPKGRFFLILKFLMAGARHQW